MTEHTIVSQELLNNIPIGVLSDAKGLSSTQLVDLPCDDFSTALLTKPPSVSTEAAGRDVCTLTEDHSTAIFKVCLSGLIVTIHFCTNA